MLVAAGLRALYGRRIAGAFIGVDMALETEAAEVVAEPTEGISLSEMFEESEVEASEVADVTAEAETEDDQGETEETVEAKAEPETEEAETPAAEQGQLAAMLAERDKRKAAEARVRELEAKIEPESRIDPIEDPEGYRTQIETDRANSELRTKITLSQSMMTELDPDYLRLEGVFKTLIADDEGNITDEGLVRRFQQADNPAKYLRDYTKEYESVEAMKDPKYEENLEVKIRAKVLAEIAENAKKGVSAADVPDLTNATSVGSNSVQAEGPTTLESLF